MNYDADITRALRTPGGHLHIGRGGFVLHYANGRLSGYDCETVKAAAIRARLPVIDSRVAPFDAVAKLSISGPMIAVNKAPGPRPWHAFSEALLAAVAAAYRRAGAEVLNVPEDDETEPFFRELPPGPAVALVDFWLAHVRKAAMEGEPA